MTDVHAHVLPLVDDGANDFESSVEMLLEAQKQGIKNVILTPHHRGEYKNTVEQIKEKFEILKKIVSEKGIGINLFLGQEVYYDNIVNLLEQGKVLTMNDTKFVLIEFSFAERVDMSETIYTLKRLGYKPIVAHFERYSYVTIQDAIDIKDAGGYLQINADSIVGKAKKWHKKFIKQLFNEQLVDFVASDIHSNRENLMAKAYLHVKKKFGKTAALVVFEENAKEIIKG